MSSKDYRETKALAEDFLARYGGMMSITDLARELGTNRENAKRWAMEKGIGIQVNKRIKVESRVFAREIVRARGMC